MSTGRDELLWAVVNYDTEHPDYEELSDIGDGQYLCSVAADLIQELRKERDAAQARVNGLCPEVIAFAHLMQRKLDANAHKDGQGWDRDGTGKRGWKNCDVSFLRGKLTEEVVELIVAIREPTNHDNVAEEAADVGNIAMLLADICGALSQPADPDSPDSDLPLMARRPGLEEADQIRWDRSGRALILVTHPDGETVGEYRPDGCALDDQQRAGQRYLIADTDEHGLPVVERTAEMPEWATHKITWLNDGMVDFTDSTPIALEANRSGAVSERIEDYRP